MKKNNRQRPKMMRGPYCGGTVELRSAEGIYKEDVHKTMLLSIYYHSCIWEQSRKSSVILPHIHY